MQFEKKHLPFILFLFLSASAHAENRYLTVQDLQRVQAVKQLLYGVDKESLRQTINELEKTRHFQINLQIREAMAKAYADIVNEQNVTGPKKKEWLYSMVCLNMAYLQFGGGTGDAGGTTSLNRLIRRKLIEYLPPGVLKQPGFIYSLD